MVLHGITRNFPTEKEEDIFNWEKVTKSSRFNTQRIFHIHNFLLSITLLIIEMTSTMSVTTRCSRQSFEHLHFFLILQLFVRDKFFLWHGEGCITWNVIFIVYNLIKNSSRPMGGRISTVRPESHQSFIFCSRKSC